MADKKRNVVLNFKMDGQVQYAQTLKELNMIMNTAAKEYKNHIAAMDKDASATDKLRAEKKKLEIQMEAAKKRTKMLSDEFEEMAKDTNTTSEELNKMYGQLLDSQNAEVSLQKSLDRVNEGLSDQAQEARDAKDTLEKLKGESKLLEAEQKNLTSSFKLQKAELGENASEAEKLELAQKQLSQQMDLSERTVQNLERQLEETKKVYGENSVEVMQLETKLNDARTTIKKFNTSLDDMGESGKDAGDGLEEIGKKIDLNNLLEATELLQGITDKLLEIGGASIESALTFGDSQTTLQANLSLTEEQAESLNKVVSEVFRNGIVGSSEEATEAVLLVKQSFGDLNDVELENLTNKITAIAKRTGTDVNENVLAAKRLMDEFKISGEEATDLIAAGFQNGLNKSGDFLDTLNEYSPHFEAAGYTANEFLQILNNGLENGSMNTDKAADAVKELQVRMGDGSLKKVIDEFSKGTQETFKNWEKGKATVADVAESISKDLNKMTPKEQQEALSLLSSQFEDLGIDGAAALFSVGDAFTDVNGKADEFAQKSPGEKWESSLRELKEAMLPIGESLIDVLTPIVEGLAKMAEWFSNLPGPVADFIAVFGGIIAVVGALTPIIIGVIAAVTTIGSIMVPIIGIIAAVAAAIALIVIAVKNWGAITDWIGEKWDSFTSWISGAISSMKDGFVTKFNEIKDGVTNSINSLKENAVNKVNELKTKFVDGVNTLKNGAVEKFNNLKSSATDVVNGFKNNIVNKVTELKASFVNKVQEIKDGAVNKFNSLKSEAGRVMTEAKNKIVSPITEAKEKIKGIIESIKSFFSNMKLKIPKIEMPKLPKFSIDGKFSLNPPSVPKLSVKWNAKGAIFTEPTIFGASGGRLQGAGEAGPEAALPLNDETLGAIGKGIALNMAGIVDDRPIIIQIDGKTIVEVTKNRMDESLNDITKAKNFGVGRNG